MTANEKRAMVAAKYREFIGRNKYSQSLRNYCCKKYKDGNYYSDCSSSVSYAYSEAGFGFGVLNTVGMYQSGKFERVPVKIVNGQIADPAQLRVGDILLYAGSDDSRPGCVGHAEMLGEVNGEMDGGRFILYGHGSGLAKKTEMTAKNASRYKKKTSTRVGNTGLIRVVRYIRDDDTKGDDDLKVKSGVWNVRKGPGTGFEIIGHVIGGDQVEKVNAEGWSFVEKDGEVGWVSNKALEAET